MNLFLDLSEYHECECRMGMEASCGEAAASARSLAISTL